MNTYFEDLSTALKQGAYLAECQMEQLALNEEQGIYDEEALEELKYRLESMEQTIEQIKNEFNIYH